MIYWCPHCSHTCEDVRPAKTSASANLSIDGIARPSPDSLRRRAFSIRLTAPYLTSLRQTHASDVGWILVSSRRHGIRGYVSEVPVAPHGAIDHQCDRHAAHLPVCRVPPRLERAGPAVETGLISRPSGLLGDLVSWLSGQDSPVHGVPEQICR